MQGPSPGVLRPSMSGPQRSIPIKIILALVLAIVLAIGVVSTASAQTSVSMGINQPGVYGRINIGNVSPPTLYRAEPVIIVPPRVAADRQPVCLYVPSTHAQNWGRYCGQYNACGQPVYFVRDEWVRERYEREHPGWNRGRHRGWDKHDGRRDDERANDDRLGNSKKDKHWE